MARILILSPIEILGKTLPTGRVIRSSSTASYIAKYGDSIAVYEEDQYTQMDHHRRQLLRPAEARQAMTQMSVEHTSPYPITYDYSEPGPVVLDNDSVSYTTEETDPKQLAKWDTAIDIWASEERARIAQGESSLHLTT